MIMPRATGHQKGGSLRFIRLESRTTVLGSVILRTVVASAVRSGKQKQFRVSSSVMNQTQDSTRIRSEASSHTYYSVIDEYQEANRTISHDIELVHSYSLRIDDHVQESGGKTTVTETTNGNVHNRGKQSQNVAPDKATGTQIQHKQGYPAKPKLSSGNVPPRVPSQTPLREDRQDRVASRLG